VFSKVVKVQVKRLYELKGYKAHQFKMEFLNKVVAAVEKQRYGQVHQRLEPALH